MKKIDLINHNFDFMINSILILALLSVPIYLLKLFHIDNVDLIYSVLVIIILISSLAVNVKNAKIIKIIFLILLILIIVYICFYDLLFDQLIKFGKNGGIRFGIINTIFNTFGFYRFQNFADYSSYGGSFLVNGNIVNGAINNFEINSNSITISRFLTARYLLLFSLSGISFAVGRKNIKICLIAVASLLTGNYTALLLLFAFVYPVFYLLSLISSFVCYFISYAVGLKLGFLCSPSVFELFIHNSNQIYSAVICLLVFCLSYYSACLAKEKLK